ncbi:MAG: hypothetical protein FWD77_04010 [Betaproteobacteria bacterium]|nr:hypothetical protein [Betaproteobacteria bacterium]
MNKSSGHIAARLIVFLAALALCVLLLEYHFQGKLGLFFSSSLPDNPIVIQDDIWWFYLQGGRVFAVPEKYIPEKRIEDIRNNPGLLNIRKVGGFALDMLLPKLEGYSRELDESRGIGVFGGRLNVVLQADPNGRTGKEVEEDLFFNDYLYSRQHSESATRISDNPVIERITLKGSYGRSNSYFLIEGNNRVKKMLTCDPDNIKRGRNAVRKCTLYAATYNEGIQYQMIFDQTYESDWLDISNRVEALLHSFERPVAKMPVP